MSKAAKRREAGRKRDQHGTGKNNRVYALRQEPNGPLFELPTVPDGSPLVRWMLVGTDEQCHIQLKPHAMHAQGEIADVHCFLRLTATDVRVCQYEEGGSFDINNVAVIDGQVALRPGNVLVIAGLSWGGLCDRNEGGQTDRTRGGQTDRAGGGQTDRTDAPRRFV